MVPLGAIAKMPRNGTPTIIDWIAAGVGAAVYLCCFFAAIVAIMSSIMR